MANKAIMYKRLFLLIAVILVMIFAVTTLAGCNSLSKGWENIQQIWRGETTGSDQTDTPSLTEDPQTTAPDDTDETIPTTEPPQGEEFVRISKMLDPLLWVVGEQLYYIDLNNNTLHHRYDLTDKSQGEGLVAPTIDELLLEDVTAIIGFSEKRIFCLSEAMTDTDGNLVYDVIAVDYEGHKSETVLHNINNGTVLDDEWILASRFNQPMEIVVIDLKNEEEHIIFTDDGNLYPGMDDPDYAIGCSFHKMNDGTRIEIAYPGYSEYPFVRYLLMREGEIAEDSKLAPWQDNLGENMYDNGMYHALQRVKTYDDLVLYEQIKGDGTTLLVYDHPDQYFEIINSDEYYLIDFFYHRGKVQAQVFWPFASGEQSTEQIMIYDPQAGDQIKSVAHPYDSLHQYQDKLVGMKVKETNQTNVNNVEGRIAIDLLDADGKAEITLLDQEIKTGSYYGNLHYKVWLAGHDLVIYYESYEPETGQIRSTSYEWLFINLAS